MKKYLLDAQEYATVLAALRFWQRRLGGRNIMGECPPEPEDDIASSAGEFEPLNEDDIDKLIERLQFEDNVT